MWNEECGMRNGLLRGSDDAADDGNGETIHREGYRQEDDVEEIHIVFVCLILTLCLQR